MQPEYLAIAAKMLDMDSIEQLPDRLVDTLNSVDARIKKIDPESGSMSIQTVSLVISDWQYEQVCIDRALYASLM